MAKMKLASLLDDLANEMAQTATTKEAADLSEKISMPTISSNIGNILRKLASDMREQTQDVTYEDVETAAGKTRDSRAA